MQENNYHGAEDALVTAIGLPGVKKTGEMLLSSFLLGLNTFQQFFQ